MLGFESRPGPSWNQCVIRGCRTSLLRKGLKCDTRWRNLTALWCKDRGLSIETFTQNNVLFKIKPYDIIVKAFQFFRLLEKSAKFLNATRVGAIWQHCEVRIEGCPLNFTLRIMCSLRWTENISLWRGLKFSTFRNFSKSPECDNAYTRSDSTLRSFPSISLQTYHMLGPKPGKDKGRIVLIDLLESHSWNLADFS